MKKNKRVLIQADKLVKQYKKRSVVNDLNLEVREGEVLAIIGPNGAGKSTTLSMLLGIIKPDSGIVRRWGEDYRKELGVQLQATPFFEGYTAKENISLFAALYQIRLTEAEIVQKLAEAHLQDSGHIIASKLSVGQQKCLAIIVTTLHSPKLVVLDEPSAGLDPKAQKEVREMIKRLKAKGTTVVFSSHDMSEVEKLADRLIIIEKGQVALEGEPGKLLASSGQKSLEELYLEIV